ncbi:MAG: isochorismatase family protein [Verrucomicrobiales bacterium]|nr:isochorismatase family protein [Verrucomicrobiales bacterium]
MKQIFGLLLFLAVVLPLSAAELDFRFRTQTETGDGSGKFHSIIKLGTWDAAKTCIVICDMWDDHYCRNAARRVGEMAPRMNEVIKKARAEGVLIIHCPSGCMNVYEGTEARKRAQAAPKVEAKILLKSWCYLDPSKEAPMPVKVDQPCDDEGKLRERKRFYSKQIDTLEIDQSKDAITDSTEAYYLMKERGIENVILMGVHTNMCVLGRPFGIRQMVAAGQNVVLMRDLTDTMYNPREEPFVNHFTGNDLVFEHIERHWCPTITSNQILGDDAPYKFPGDQRKHIVMVMAEREYKTADTLPNFAIEELGKDFKISLVYAEVEDKNHFPGLEILKDADLVLLSVRRRNPSKEQLNLFREHIAAGKPLVGIRTASHSFHQNQKEQPKSGDEWRDFDSTVLGGNYHGHHPNNVTTFAQAAGNQEDHPILKGVSNRRVQTFGSLYKVRPLEKGTTVLMNGTGYGLKEGEPVAWTHTSPGGGRVFYTSLGHPYDFNITDFRILLRNAIYWAVEVEPPAEKKDGEKADGC